MILCGDCMELKDLRKQIDELDEELLLVISKRFSLMPLVAEIKRKSNLDVKQNGREKELITDIRSKAEQKNLDPDFIERIITEIMTESKKIQKRSM